MGHDLESDLEFYVQAADLRLGQEDSASLLHALAKKLELNLPDQTQVVRGGGFWTKERPVKEITVDCGERRLQLVQEGKALQPKVVTVVRGIALKTSDVTLDQWLDELASELNRMARESTQLRATLRRFIDA